MDVWLRIKHGWFAALLLVCLLAGPVIAATDVLDVDPDTVTVFTEKGTGIDSGFSVRNPGTGPQDVLLYYVRPAGSTEYFTLEPRYVTFPAENQTVPARGYREIPVALALGDLPSGEYRGKIHVAGNATDITVPIVAKVKDTVLLPLILLVISVIVSVLLFNWNLSWQKHVELKRSILDLRSKINEDRDIKDNEFARLFYDRIGAALDSAGEKIVAGNYTDADDQRKFAQKLWDKWNDNKPVWKPHLETSVEIREMVPLLRNGFSRFLTDNQKNNFIFLNDIEDGNRRFWEGIANDVSEAKFDVRPLKDLRDNAQRVKNLLEQMRGTAKACKATGDAGQQKDCCRKLGTFTEKIRGKPLSQLDFDGLKEKLDAILQPPKPAVTGTDMSVYGIPSRFAGTVRTLPEWIPLSAITELEVLKWTTLVIDVFKSVILPIALLSIIGLFLLYYQNPVFGSVTDYITLVVWGFLSCAGTEGIMGKVQAYKLEKSTAQA